MSETGCYMYAVVRNDHAGDLSYVQGLRASPVRRVGHRGLAAVVSDVDLEEFGEAGLRRNLEDLRWLEKVARGHHAVVHTVAAGGPTAPMRLATICLGDDAVRALLDEWHDALQGALRRVQGRTEWSVKAYAPQLNQSAEPASSNAAGPGAGTAYLVRRKTAIAERESRAQAAEADAHEVHATLSRHAAASRRLPPQDRKLTGHQGTMTLNAAYLVENEHAATFRAAVEKAAEQYPGTKLDLRGPWPPYSFATLEEP